MYPGEGKLGDFSLIISTENTGHVGSDSEVWSETKGDIAFFR